MRSPRRWLWEWREWWEPVIPIRFPVPDILLPPREDWSREYDESAVVDADGVYCGECDEVEER